MGSLLPFNASKSILSSNPSKFNILSLSKKIDSDFTPVTIGISDVPSIQPK